jgi:hypothetical protein
MEVHLLLRECSPSVNTFSVISETGFSRLGDIKEFHSQCQDEAQKRLAEALE